MIVSNLQLLTAIIGILNANRHRIYTHKDTLEHSPTKHDSELQNREESVLKDEERQEGEIQKFREEEDSSIDQPRFTKANGGPLQEKVYFPYIYSYG